MRRLGTLLIVCFALWMMPLPTQAIQAQAGVTVTCSDGTRFENGVTVTVHAMPAGIQYTATALGLKDFNPVLAVIDPATGKGQCNDNNSAAGTYAAYLPTLGTVAPNPHTAQVTFSPISGSPSADVTLVVGSASGQGGEFLLDLEGMTITPEHPQDAFSVNITQSMVDSGVKLTVYMMHRQVSQLDPYMVEADNSLNPLIDQTGKRIECDDAGDSSVCQAGSVNLANYSVTLGTGILAGHPYDAMLSLPLKQVAIKSDPTQNALNFVMGASPRKATQGAYFVILDLGIAAAPPANGSTSDVSSTAQAPDSGTASGVSVTCSDGTHFDNGVTITVRHMPLGYSYTATAIGVKGFDPVLAVLNSTTRQASCSDNTPGAAFYAATLPSTGSVTASRKSAQITFSQNSGQSFADISLVVGSSSAQSGEFLLLLEGMTATPQNGAGDAFSISLTPAMLASSAPLTVYMLATAQSKLDPYIALTNDQFLPLADSQGKRIDCDDAGTGGLCQTNSVDLSGSSVTTAAGKLIGRPEDAMLTFTGDHETQATFVMAASPQHVTQGQYLVVFHVG